MKSRTKHLCHTSAAETVLMQRKGPPTFRWLVGKGRKNKSGELSQLLCLDHFFPCSLSIKERSIVAFSKAYVFLLILMWHARPIRGAVSPKQFNMFLHDKKKQKELNLPLDQKAMLIFDVFTGHVTEKVTSTIEENNCVITYLPNNFSNQFQLLDLNVNGQAKQFLKKKFECWYAQ